MKKSKAYLEGFKDGYFTVLEMLKCTELDQGDRVWIEAEFEHQPDWEISPKMYMELWDPCHLCSSIYHPTKEHNDHSS